MILISLVMVFFLCTNASAFRCGNGLVTSGDTKMQVLVTCGKPTSKEKACEDSQTTIRTDVKGRKIKSKKCGNKVEVWHYNCGDNDFIYALTFDDGILKKETTEGQGKGKSDCLGK
jgi:hypothetical protein